MNVNLFDFAKAYQNELLKSGRKVCFSQSSALISSTVRDRLLTGLGNALISLGMMVKSWRACSELGRCTDVTQGRVQA